MSLAFLGEAIDNIRVYKHLKRQILNKLYFPVNQRSPFNSTTDKDGSIMDVSFVSLVSSFCLEM